MNLVRTGWEVHDQGQYMEVLPQDDLKEHLAGDECWCKPRIESVLDGQPDKIIIHEALDGRD